MDLDSAADLGAAGDHNRRLVDEGCKECDSRRDLDYHLDRHVEHHRHGEAAGIEVAAAGIHSAVAAEGLEGVLKEEVEEEGSCSQPSGQSLLLLERLARSVVVEYRGRSRSCTADGEGILDSLSPNIKVNR